MHYIIHKDGSITSKTSKDGEWIQHSGNSPSLTHDSEGNHNIEDSMTSFLHHAREHFKAIKAEFEDKAHEIHDHIQDMIHKFLHEEDPHNEDEHKEDEHTSNTDESHTNEAEIDDADEEPTPIQITKPSTPASNEDEKPAELVVSGKTTQPAPPTQAATDNNSSGGGDRVEIVQNPDGSTTKITHHSNGSSSRTRSYKSSHSWSSSLTSPVFTSDSSGKTNLEDQMKTWMAAADKQFKDSKALFEHHTQDIIKHQADGEDDKTHSTSAPAPVAKK